MKQAVRLFGTPFGWILQEALSAGRPRCVRPKQAEGGHREEEGWEHPFLLRALG